MGDTSAKIARDTIETAFSSCRLRIQTWCIRAKHSGEETYTLLGISITINLKNIVFQISDVPAKFYPILLRVAQAALPEGVTLNVVEHQREHDEIRYVPDNDLRELKEQLIEMGGPRKLKKRK